MSRRSAEETEAIRSEFRHMEERYASAPTVEQMPGRSLADKGIRGPTAAHALEEVHVPLNFAYMSFTTGSSAMQNPVCILPEEIPGRKDAGAKALRMAGILPGNRMLVTYPPLVNVFSKACLEEYGICWNFLRRSCRESLIAEWMEDGTEVTIGESSFLRAALDDVVRMSMEDLLPDKMILLAAGTPLDPCLMEILYRHFPGWKLYDLYGCQEFGWLALNGTPLRDDLVLLSDAGNPEEIYPAAGGIVVGDCFRRGKHCLNPEGRLATHDRIPSSMEWETWILEAPVQELTLRRALKSILRVKGRVVYAAQDVICGSSRLRVRISPAGERKNGVLLEEEEILTLLHTMIEAQKQYQKKQKRDGAWQKNGSMEQT